MSFCLQILAVDKKVPELRLLLEIHSDLSLGQYCVLVDDDAIRKHASERQNEISPFSLLFSYTNCKNNALNMIVLRSTELLMTVCNLSA